MNLKLKARLTEIDEAEAYLFLVRLKEKYPELVRMRSQMPELMWATCENLGLSNDAVIKFDKMAKDIREFCKTKPSAFKGVKREDQQEEVQSQG